MSVILPLECAAAPESSQSPAQSGEPCREALARVLASECFGKSARLSSFLRYVCTATVDGQAALLCEQHIGVAVFGRPDHYNPADDTIVRSSARLLRQRLVQYYEDEGRLDDLRIAIPRGTYVPVFVPAASGAKTGLEEAAVQPPAPAPAQAPPAAAPPLPAPEARAPRHRGLMVSAGLLLGLLVLAGGWLRQDARPRSIVESFWATLLPAERDALLVVSDAALVRYQVETHTQLSLEDYASKHLGEWPPAADQAAAQFRTHRYTSMTSVQLAAELGKRATAAPQRLHLRFARDLHLADLKQANVILLGVVQANPWGELYRSQLNFHIDWNREQPDSFQIRNDQPRPGEKAAYEFRVDDPHHRGFATIAYTRGLGGDGHALLLGGTTAAGTEAAIELLFDPARMTPLLQKARQPDGSIGGFEVLLQCLLQANGSTNTEILGLRVHAPESAVFHRETSP